MIVGRIRDSSNFAAGQRSEIGRYEVPTEVSLPGFGIGWSMKTSISPESDRSRLRGWRGAVMYSMALGPRFFKWKMLSLSGPKALLFIQLLIALLTRSVVNVCVISKDFLIVSLVTNRSSLQEVCLPSYDVLSCWLNLVASCLDDENEIPLKVIASFSASRFALPSIPLIVLHSLVRSVFWSMVSTKFFVCFFVSKLFVVCAHKYGSGCLYSILAVQVRWGLFT